MQKTVSSGFDFFGPSQSNPADIRACGGLADVTYDNNVVLRKRRQKKTALTSLKENVA